MEKYLSIVDNVQERTTLLGYQITNWWSKKGGV